MFVSFWIPESVNVRGCASIQQSRWANIHFFGHKFWGKKRYWQTLFLQMQRRGLISHLSLLAVLSCEEWCEMSLSIRKSKFQILEGLKTVLLTSFVAGAMIYWLNSWLVRLIRGEARGRRNFAVIYEVGRDSRYAVERSVRSEDERNLWAAWKCR